MTIYNVGENPPEWVSHLTSLLLILVGAALTYATQIYFERKKEREQNRRHAWSLLHTMQAMVEDLISLDQMRLESLRIAVTKHRVDVEFWQKWQERVGYGDPNMRFSADELIVLSSMHDGVFTTKVREVEKAHRIFSEAAQKLFGTTSRHGRVLLNPAK